MAKSCRFVCGVDVSRDCVAAASQRHPHLQFHVLDVMHNPQVPRNVAPFPSRKLSLAQA